jgi:hypothetical protein
MPSTWMDPLLKAQQATRRNHAKATAAIWTASEPSEAFSAKQSPDDDFSIPKRRERSLMHWDSLGLETTADWETDPLDILPEIEREIGISEWIDRETGEPAEGQSPPHLEIE